jgi:hypothetical protein
VGTDTYTRHYDQGNYDLPVFEIAMRGDVKLSRIEMDADAPQLSLEWWTLHE